MIGCTMANKNKHYPVQNEILFSSPAGSGLTVIRADEGLSGLNRRLYRQNRVYRVKVDMVGSPNNSPNRVDVFRLRDTFMLQRGYELAMREWNKSFEEADEVVKDSVKARWRDFRIDVRPHIGDTLSSPQNLRSSGTGATVQPVTIDEFNNSIAYTPAGASRDFGLKSDVNTFDIISEYNKVGKVQPDPTVATTTAAYGELQTDLNDAMVQTLQSDGNNPPYDADDHHPLDVLEYVGSIYLNTADGLSKLSTGFFDAPLGAIYLFGQGNTCLGIDQGETPLFKVEVQKGDYKGVRAHEYVDVTDA